MPKTMRLFSVVSCSEYNSWNRFLHQLPGLVFWKDTQSRYGGCSAPFAALVGLASPEEIIGKTDYDLPWQVQGDNASFFRQGDQAALNHQPIVQQEETLALLGCEPLVVSVTKVPLTNSQGKLLGILGLATDITAHKKTEQALKNAEAQANLAKQAKADFIANIRHDLRTPFAGIMGLLDSLHAELTNPEQKTTVSLVRSASEQFLARVNQITAFSASEGELPDVILEPFSPALLIKEVRMLLQPLAEQQRLSWEVEGIADLPHQLQGDVFRCREILLSLLSNAIQFTPQGTVTLRVRCYPSEDNSLLFEIQVADNGPGIPEEQQAAIFEPFVRLQPAYQKSTLGTGLGLSLVKRYVQEVGGTLTLDSTLVQGSCFTVTLPCQPFVCSLATATTILLVEDDKMAGLAVCRLFQTLDCTVERAETAAQAHEKIESGHYALILMDLGLPDGSGLDIARAVRQLPNPQQAQTPIVALSAHLDEALREQCLHAGMQAAITKPLTLAQAEQLQHTYLPPSPSTYLKELSR